MPQYTKFLLPSSRKLARISERSLRGWQSLRFSVTGRQPTSTRWPISSCKERATSFWTGRWQNGSRTSTAELWSTHLPKPSVSDIRSKIASMTKLPKLPLRLRAIKPQFQTLLTKLLRRSIMWRHRRRVILQLRLPIPRHRCRYTCHPRSGSKAILRPRSRLARSVAGCSRGCRLMST